MTESRPSRFWVLVALFGALILAIGSFFVGREHAGPIPTPDANAKSTAQQPHASRAPVSAIRPIPSSGPLPPLDAPLAQVIGELKRRADAGEAKAACRLAAEFSVCQQADARRIETEQWLRSRQLALKLITSEANRKIAADRISAEMDARQERDTAFANHCTAIPLPSNAENLANWRRAALLGNVAAGKQYVSGNAFRWGEIMDSIGQLQTYRGEGEQLARKAAAGGDLEMMLALADAHDPNLPGQRSLLAQSVKRDPILTLTIYLKAERELAIATDPAFGELKDRVHARVEQLRESLPSPGVSRAESGAYGGVSSWVPIVVNGGTASVVPGRVRDMGPRSCEWDD